MNFPKHIKVYIVGGYVRDRLLGRECKDHDFVVVGATEDDMLKLGFSSVGADFPVFLHPKTGDEFALARKERKVAAGYNGFEVDFDPTVTLEEDLVRRDLTINAMAREVVGWNELGHAKLSDDVIDPFGGQSDLKAELLCHVSEAFAEDPVRVLRVARFAARYEFAVALDTVALMIKLFEDGELDHLVPERVWAEMEKALGETNPMAFLRTLKTCGADQLLLPELKCSGFLEQCFKDSPQDNNLRFALMCLKLSEDEINGLCDRLKVPNEFKQRAVRGQKLVNTLREELSPESVVSALEAVSGVQNEQNVVDALEVAQHSAYNTDDFFNRMVTVAVLTPNVCGVRFANLTEAQQNTLQGPAVGAALRELRLEKASKTL